MKINDITIPEEFAYAFQKSTEINPCANFDPTKLLQVSPADPATNTPTMCFLPLDAKRLWFELWCQKEGKVPRIVTQCTDIKFDVVGNNNVRYGFAVGMAEVYADDVLLASYTAGQSFSIDLIMQMDNVVQSVQGLALSKALTNAGFGAAPSTAAEEKPPVYTNPNGNGNSTLPFTIPGDAPTAPVVAPVENAPAPASSPVSAPVANSGNAADPKAAAKMVVSTMRGKFAGMKLGEILLSSPKTIEYMATTWEGDPTVKHAATLLLNDALIAQGKPPVATAP